MTQESLDKSGLTEQQSLFLDKILDGKSLAEVLSELNITRRTWKVWIENDDFRANLGKRGIEEKELVEMIDALTLNRRAYNKLLRACGNGREEAGLEEELLDRPEKIDEKTTKPCLSIIEAMAKRLGELAPKFRDHGKGKESKQSGEISPEEYDELASRLQEIRTEKKADDPADLTSPADPVEDE